MLRGRLVRFREGFVLRCTKLKERGVSQHLRKIDAIAVSHIYYYLMDKFNLQAEVFSRLKDVFEFHHWSLDGEDTFERFCSLLGMLDKNEQNCIIDLTNKFLKVDFSKYPHYINKALATFPNAIFQNIDKIYIMPLRAPEDFDKQKSSTFVAYGFHDYKTHSVFSGKTLNIIDKPTGIPKNFNSTNSILLLVDDFIGTGETAESCLEYLSGSVGLDLRKILLFALVVQRDGYDKLIKAGHKLFCADVRNKAITDDIHDPEKQYFIKVMQSIENKFNFRPDCRFGYKQSEALVKMIRTPNNTFPVYWESVPRLKYKAPFPR